MAKYEQLMKEINNLKSEVERLREVVSALFQIVIETTGIDYEMEEKTPKDSSLNN